MLKGLLQSILGGAKTPNSGLLQEGIKMLLSPQGKIPQQGNLVDEGLKLLKNIL